MPGSGRRLRLPTAGPTHVLWRRGSVSTRCCGSPRARRAPNWTSFCGSARTPPKRCCARARVLIAATRRGDGVASALARARGSGGGSESATASVHGLLLRKRCSVGRVSRASPGSSRPAAGSASRRGGRVHDVTLLSVTRESSPLIGALRRALVAYVSCGVSQAFGQPFRAA